MKGQITVLPQDEWEEWYANTEGDSGNASVEDADPASDTSRVTGAAIGGVGA